MIQQLFMETQAVFSETLPDFLIQEIKLMPKKEALFNIHFPKSGDALAKAQFRLKFEELFFIQLQLVFKTLQLRKPLHAETHFMAVCVRNALVLMYYAMI